MASSEDGFGRGDDMVIKVVVNMPTLVKELGSPVRLPERVGMGGTSWESKEVIK